MVIYKITNLVNGKIYVGQTRQPLYKRWYRHTHKSGCFAISNAIAKYGAENFTIEVIDKANTLSELNEKETFWIDKLNALSPNGYNIQTGGNAYALTELGRKHLSESHKGKQCGEDNPFYGRHHTPEAKAIFSARNKGNTYAVRKRVTCVETNVTYDSVNDAYRATGVNNISKCCKGKAEKAGGYRWRYADEVM